jgi:hypothetical protein
MKQHLDTHRPTGLVQALFADIPTGLMILLLAVASWFFGSVVLVSAWQAAKLALHHLA